jgi:glutamate--cysteine ligase
VRNLNPNYARMLLQPFSRAYKPREAIGVEIEVGLVDPLTGVSRSYGGDRGVARFLEMAAKQWQGALHYEGADSIGFKRADGTELGLESGCALEYVSTAETSLVSLVRKANRDLHDLVQIADELNLALISGAMFPFDRREDVHWAPKPRIPLMLDHFKREVGSTSQGWAAMAQIITVQTTLDFLNADDLQSKHRMANVVSPLVGALFVNSPIQAGGLTEASSRRMQIWANVDSRRVGIFEHSIGSDFCIDDLITWAIHLPMIYRVIDGHIKPAPRCVSFETLLDDGFGDGTFPVLDDWKAMLSTTWPYVRLRNTLELRIADGVHHRYWAALPALWVGLAYDRYSCDAAWNLARGYSLKGYLDAVDDVAVRGLNASIEGHPIRPMCQELLSIARDGMARRIKDGLEPEIALTYLDPLVEVIESGQTFADQLSERWRYEFGFDPRGYVQAHRYH